MIRPSLIFAGGGTGGHVFPMVAVADALRRIAPEVEVVFVGTERGMETKAVPARGYRLELMRVLPIRGGGIKGALKGMMRAAAALPEGRALVHQIAPRAVLSIGGYAAGPVSMAARTMGIPLALMEPNAVIGLANRLVAPFVQRAYTAFEGAEKHFRAGSVLRAGVPIREGFDPRPYQRSEGALSVLVIGGSQGARTLNQAVPEALARATTPVRVVHQCGQASVDDVRQRYQSLGGGRVAEVVPFIDDMPSAIAGADLVIARSGASAVSEICAVGRPSLLVPYPFAAGDHQRENARTLVRDEAAVMVENHAATAERLATEIDRLAAAPGLLARMAERACSRGKPRAADRIAQDLLELSGLEQRADSSERDATDTDDEPGSRRSRGHQPEERV